ncbi:MAG: class I SAM-dependent methyltransferase [Armatimonadetes bacterium]|nr:class I SAM-dependent methyltransferase [Armatimonadota bacterium]
MRKHPALTVALIAGLLLPALQVRSDEYIETLKARCPFYQRATGLFLPMYEPLARQMVEDYGLSEGVAVDVGSSCSSFSMELAKKTHMTVYALDIDPWAMRLLGVLVDQEGLTGRVIPIEGDALNMPLRDDFADFVFSRACIPFVSDQVQFMREVYRILKPGGVAYVGHGGFGRLLDPAERAKLVRWRLDKWAQQGPPKGWNGPKERMVDLARQAGIEQMRLITEPDVGWWLEIRKPAGQPAGDG